MELIVRRLLIFESRTGQLLAAGLGTVVASRAGMLRRFIECVESGELMANTPQDVAGSRPLRWWAGLDPLRFAVRR